MVTPVDRLFAEGAAASSAANAVPSRRGATRIGSRFENGLDGRVIATRSNFVAPSGAEIVATPSLCRGSGGGSGAPKSTGTPYLSGIRKSAAFASCHRAAPPSTIWVLDNNSAAASARIGSDASRT